LTAGTAATDYGGAAHITAKELDLIDTSFDNCSSPSEGGALYLNCTLIFVRCCGRFCTARTGTFLRIADGSTGPHELSQGTMFCCGYKKAWADENGNNVGGIYLGKQATPFFHHFNLSSNVLRREGGIYTGRGAAIYAIDSGAGFNCTYLTVHNNSGNTIIDVGGNAWYCGNTTYPCPSGYIARFTNANIVSNVGSSGFAIVYATVYGMVLTNCIFLKNSGAVDLWRSVTSSAYGGWGTQFQLTNCVFDRSPAATYYTVVSNVKVNSVTATYTIGHLNISGCYAPFTYQSGTFSQSAVFGPTSSIAPTAGHPPIASNSLCSPAWLTTDALRETSVARTDYPLPSMRLRPSASIALTATLTPVRRCDDCIGRENRRSLVR
jgi:hypothetical protein